MLIEIAETHPAQVGRRSATVIAKGGQKFDVWPEQLADFRVGAQYEVELSERQYKGRTYQSITKARPTNGATTPAANGAARPNGANGHIAPAPGTTGEPEFVGRALSALIAAGAVKYDKVQLLAATDMLRGLWGVTFGGKPRNGGPPCQQ
jgi:hypothetical protein